MLSGTPNDFRAFHKRSFMEGTHGNAELVDFPFKTFFQNAPERQAGFERAANVQFLTNRAATPISLETAEKKYLKNGKSPV